MAKNITKGDLRKQDFLVLRQSRDDTVTNVVAPNGLQIGLTDDRFRNDLTVKGSTIGEGGITGSLTQLVDGTPYLQAGANILLTTGSKGEITVATSISDVAVRRTRFDTTVTSGFQPALTLIPLTNSNMNIIGETDTDDFIDIYVNGALLRSGSLAEVTAGTRDYTVDAIYKDKTAKFAFGLNIGDVVSTTVISSGSSNVAAAGDALSLTNNAYNVNVKSDGGIQIISDELAIKTKADGGLATSADGLFVDISNQSDLGTNIVTGDFVLIYDTDAATIKKVSVGNLQGAGATIDIAGVSNTLTEANLASGDLFAVADISSANEAKKITVEDFGQYLAGGTNAGIGESSGKLTIDLNDLTAGVVAVGSDSFAFIDSDDNATKKEAIADLITAVAGTVTTTGLAASSGVLKIDIPNVTQVGTLHSSDQVLIYDADVGALRRTTINDIGLGAVAPPAAEYVTLATNGTLSNERVLTAGDGIDLTDGGAGSTVTMAVDVTDVIDTAAGLKENSNNIQVALKSSSGLVFDSGEIKIDYGSSAGSAAQGNNTVNIIAGDGLKSGGQFQLGAASSTIQLDIKPSDFAGNGLTTAGDDLVVSIGAGNNVSITTGSDGSFIINSALPAEGQFVAGDGLDLTGQTFSVDLKANGGLEIDSTELKVKPDDFVGDGLEVSSGNIQAKKNTSPAATSIPVQVSSDGLSFLVDNTTIEKTGEAIRVKDGSITNAKLANDSLTVTAGDGLRTGGSVSLGGSVTLEVDISDIVGNGLLDNGAGDIVIDDSIVATLSGSVFSGHVGVTGSIHSTAELSGSIVKASRLSGSLTTLENGDPYLFAGTGISLATGSNGQITITGNVGDITAVTASTGLTGGGDTGDVSLAIDDSIVATLSGSQFSGNIGITGSLGVIGGISGSLTQLSDGSSYIIAGDNVTITTGSSGALTISVAGGEGGGLGTITGVTAGTGLSGGGTTGTVALNIDDSVIATLSGSVFSGHVGVSGSIHSTAEISGSIIKAPAITGSLTHLEDGSSYLIAGNNIQITTGSSGAVTITGTSSGDMTAVNAGTGLIGGGDSGDVTLAIDDSVVVTLTSSATFSNGLSGSLTTLADGSSYLIAGSNVGIISASNGAITISSTDTNTEYTAGDGLDLTGTVFSLDLKDDSGLIIDSSELSIDDAVIATLSGSQFSGNVGITGSLGITGGLSGSLTNLSDGTSYLVAGNNIQITTGSSGAVTITGTSSGDMTAVTAGTGLSGGGSSGDVTLAIDDSIVATLSGSIFSGHVGITGSLHATAEISGSIVRAPALTGSLTKLEDGSSYLIAGNNVTITSASNGSVTIAASGGGGGGSITATSGSTTINSMSTLRFGPGLVMNEDASGIASVTASIGHAEDGLFTDGLFTDFIPTTPIGTAVDRFNEILLALAPNPAPPLDDIDCNTSNGSSAKLSFGSSNDQSAGSPAYISSNTAAGFSAVDVNETFEAATSGNNIRKGVYNGATVITGDLNEDIPINQHNTGVTNHVANAFGNANEGTLELKVNGSLVHSVDLTLDNAGSGNPGSGSASKLNGNSSGFINLSQTGSAVQSNNVSFSAFQHRTGRYQVGTADQRNGWNFAQVVHNRGTVQTETNYVEWVNDNNSDALASAGSSLTFEGSGSIHLSGVEYFRSGSLEYKNRVSNAYKFVYDTTNITFSTSNSATVASGQTFNFAAQSKPTIDTASGETHAKILHLTSSSDLDATTFINGQITVGSNVTHPLKSNLSNSGTATVSQILIYDRANTSTNTQETFLRENFRLVSGSYDSQANVEDSNNAWDSSIFMTASNGGHSDGLQFYNAQLLSPLNTISSGDFSGFSNGPAQNPDYSGISGNRTFIRWFKNTTGSSKQDLSIAINGAGTIVQETASKSGNQIAILVKIPGKTGWMDLSQTFVLDSVSDGSGAHIDNAILNFDSTLNATNYVAFGNVNLTNDEYVVVKVIADESWSGNISNITVAFGAGTGTLTTVPDLDDIDSDNTGTAANLSFGAAKSITGYSNSATAAGFSATDLNGLYQTAETSNNLKRAVFNGSQTMEGDLNEDVSSPGNDFVANAFSDANSGSLSLEVNGSVIHTLEITGSQTLVGNGVPGSGSGTSLNANGSGFISLSNWAPGLFDNGVPSFGEIQRTGRYRITTDEQRNGWNYARVIHTVGGSARTTNFVEWINDNNSNALSSAGNGLSIFGDNSHSFISGVKYFNSPSGSILTRVSNIYKNVYSDSNSAISFTSLSNATASKLVQSGSGLSSTKSTSSSTDSLQTLNTATDSQNELLHVSGTINFSRSKSLPGTYTTAFSCGGALVFDHPLKSNLTVGTQTTTNLLVWTPSDTSNANTNEHFTAEQYRLVSGSYTSQAAVSGGSNDWDSQQSMNDQSNYPEHATGLLVYDTYLIPPKDGGSSGDFRNHDEGGGIESPAGNVNYSSGVLTNATRDYFRSFRNNTTDDRPNITITLYGDAVIKGRVGANQGTLGADKNIFVEVGIPGKSGLLDLGRPSAGSGNTNEGDGCLSGDLNATITNSGVSNTCTFNGVTVDGTSSSSGEYIVIRISASKNWTGYLDRISVAWS